MSPVPPASAPSRLRTSIGCPATRRSSTPTCEPNEIITAIELPAQGFAANYSYLKIRDRLSYAFALVSVAAALELDGGRIKEARLALGGVAHKPWRDPEAEAALRGQAADEAAFGTRGRCAAARRQGFRAQRLQDRSGAPRHRAHADAGRAAARRNRSPARKSGERHDHLTSAPPTSRVDGRAKVTGAAQYAGEFNVPGLAYGCVVASTIAKGRIARIDASEALAVEGVIDVLTHENRPQMADTDKAYKDDVAPEAGSPFRPLYDDKIMFNGQPIALVRGRRLGDRALRGLARACRIRNGSPRHRPACAAR